MPEFFTAERDGRVLVVSIDQLRGDRLDPELPGGLGRLAREGRVYRDAVLDHAILDKVVTVGSGAVLGDARDAGTGTTPTDAPRSRPTAPSARRARSTDRRARCRRRPRARLPVHG